MKPGVTVAADVPDEPLRSCRADAEQVKRAPHQPRRQRGRGDARAAAGCGSVAARGGGTRARSSWRTTAPASPRRSASASSTPTYSTKARGSGLGLAIVARIAAEHAGRVRVEENVPHGCRFLLEWPAA